MAALIHPQTDRRANQHHVRPSAHDHAAATQFGSQSLRALVFVVLEMDFQSSPSPIFVAGPINITKDDRKLAARTVHAGCRMHPYSYTAPLEYVVDTLHVPVIELTVVLCRYHHCDCSP